MVMKHTRRARRWHAAASALRLAGGMYARANAQRIGVSTRRRGESSRGIAK